MTVRDSDLASGLLAKYGGHFDGSLWTLSGGRKVEAFLGSWSQSTRRSDVAAALALMRSPAADAQRRSSADYLLAFASQPLSFAQIKALLPHMSTWSLRRLLDDLVREERLERLPSKVRPGGRGTTGYRYRVPGFV